MSKTNVRKQNGPSTKRRGRYRSIVGKRRTFAIAGVILSLLGASAAVSRWGDTSTMTLGARPAPAVSPMPLDAAHPSKEYIYAGGRLVATEEASGCSGGIVASTNLIATASSTSAVNLTWSAFTGPVDHYEVERRTTGSFATVIFNVPPASPTVSATDSPLSPNTAYLYKVRAFDSANCPSGYGNVDLATTTIFSETVTFGVTVKAIHITELFTAVNAVRVSAGLGTFSWPTPPAPPTVGGAIKKDHVQLLRSNLDPARSALGLTPQSYTNNPLNVGDIVNAAHIQELRNGVK